MKPQYVFLILFALFITGLSDGLEAALAALGPIGIVLGITVSWCINVTMGAGLIFLLIYNGMFYPQYLYPGIAAGAVPGLDSLPFWVLVVVLCIIKKTGEEAPGVVGQVARVAGAAALVSSNPATVRGAVKTLKTLEQVRQPAQPQAAATLEREPQAQQRVGIDLKNVQAIPKTA
jgi:hypothetical protein